MVERSAYYLSLQEDEKDRYNSKCYFINDTDPYLVNDHGQDPSEYPPVSMVEIHEYLVQRKCTYSKKDFKAYKSLEAYRAYEAGWVKSIGVKSFPDVKLILSRIHHSQRLNEPPSKTWVICHKNGDILSAHCDCVAGLSESCSHVGATLFAIESIVRKREELSVTDVPAYWRVPKKLAPPSAVANIQYGRKNKELTSVRVPFLPPSTNEDEKSILGALYSLQYNPVAVAVTAPYNDKVIAQVKEKYEGKSLLSLRNSDFDNMSHEQLITAANNLVIPFPDPKLVEEETRDQSKNISWYLYREGRVTASNFKGVCHTKLLKPSMSLVKKVCYPRDMKFSSKATCYGCKHEGVALKCFKNSMNSQHVNFQLSSSGLILHPEYPVFGASPDGIARCDCPEEIRDDSQPHGTWVVEVKCPFCARNIDMEELINLKKFYLERIESGGCKLKNNHQYFYQIQMQMALTKTSMCHFVVWSPQQIIIDTVQFDEQFWKEASKKAEIFHKCVIVPEILCKFWTKKELEEPSSSKKRKTKNKL